MRANLPSNVMARSMSGMPPSWSTPPFNPNIPAPVMTGPTGFGGIGGQILSYFSPAMAQAATTLDWGAIIGQIASGGIGGAILMVIVGMLKGMMAK